MDNRNGVKKVKEKQEKYRNQAEARWGSDRVRQSNQRWNSYDDDKKEQIKAECQTIFQALADNMHHGVESQIVQDLMVRWHHFFSYFYEPSLEVLRGLGDVYQHDPEFRQFFEVIDPELPDFVHSAVNCYVDELEMRWLESQYEVLQE